MSRASRPTREPALAVGVQRVVDRELALHVLEIIAGDLAEAARHGVETPGFLGDAARVGIGASHDEGEGLERGVRQAVLVEEGIERAALPVMAELDPRDVVRRGALARGRRHHIGVGDEEKLGLLVDEAADEPWAGDPVDAGLRPGDPLHDALHPSSRRSRRSRMAARAAGSPALTFGTSSHCSTLGPSGLPSAAAGPRAQPKAMTRVAPAAISRVTRRGFWPVRSTPSAL